MYSPDSSHTRDIVSVATQRYAMDIPFFASKIPLDERLRAAPLAGESVVHSAPGSPPALAFRDLAVEIEAWLKEPGAEDAGSIARRASEQMTQGDTAGAYRDFFRATKVGPDLVEAWIGRAQTAADASEVIRCWAQALQLDATSDVARNELSNRVLDQIARSQASDVPGLLMLGDSLVSANQLVAAELYFRRVTRLDPANPGAWLGLARAAENSRAALGYCERALQLDPDNAEVTFELEKAKERVRSQSATLVEAARTMARKGERDKAYEIFLTAAELDPQNDLAWLGCAHMTGVQRSALKFAEKALQANPGNEEAKNLQRWLWVPEHEPIELPFGWQTWASIAVALIIFGLAVSVILQHLGQ
jgi:tetratricopeptide (TPR) repeat protein